MDLRNCWFLTGPTASGKTAVGVELARRIGAEIVSLDSMALYRGMDIGTAKPSLAERRGVPHHLIDILDPNDDFSVAQYLTSATAAVDQIESRGQRALFVGGTPLYLKTLLRGLFEGPPADLNLRRELIEDARRLGGDVLLARLAAVDPAAALRLHASDIKRIVRALEVHTLTGRPISEQQSQFDRGRPADQCRVFALSWPREALRARIDARVDEMFRRGLVDEVRSLLARRGGIGRTASQAVGHREVAAHLDGTPGLPETIELVKTRTRQIAKRQETWFRSLSECRFVQMAPSRTSIEVANAIAVS